MPDKCCVPECRGNYHNTKDHIGEKVSVFKFPDDPDLRAKWIRMIPRKDYEITRNTVVCEKHFSPEFVVRVDVLTRPDGSVLREPRKRPKLTKDAYPSIFPHTPRYLTSEPARKRKAPDDRRLELNVREEQMFSDWMSGDKIVSFDDLCIKANDYVKSSEDIEWLVIRRREYLCISAAELFGIPRFNVVIRIREVMTVDVFKGESHLSSDSLRWVLGTDSKLVCWSQLSSLLSHFATCAKGSSLSVQDQAKLVDVALDELIE